MTLERGGVHIASLPGLGRRPALIVSADSVNLRLRQPVVARITAADRPRVLSTFVRLDASEAGLDRESFVLCHDLTTVAADGIGARLALLSAKRMEEVDAALERALDLV